MQMMWGFVVLLAVIVFGSAIGGYMGQNQAFEKMGFEPPEIAALEAQCHRTCLHSFAEQDVNISTTPQMIEGLTTCLRWCDGEFRE